MSTDLKLPPDSGDDIVPGIVVQDASEGGRRHLTSPDDCDVEGGSLTAASPPSIQQQSRISLISRQLRTFLWRIPILKRFGSFVILPISILLMVNLGVWAIVGIVLRYHPYSQLRFRRLTT